jgi:hypothetical protein
MSKKWTYIDFLTVANKKFNNYFEYKHIKDEFIKGTRSKITITCPKHGDFKQIVFNHLRSVSSCPICEADKRKNDINNIIDRFKKIHNNLYEYIIKENFKYHSSTKITIICKKHGEFEQLISNHYMGHGCDKCARELQNKKKLKYNLDIFLAKAKEIHKNKYNYSLSKYENVSKKIIIICPNHGEFYQTFTEHIHMKHGCPKCANENTGLLNSLTLDEFLERAKLKHKDKYDYSLVNYKNNSEKVKIICKKHGEFEQIPSLHLNGHGCPKCNSSKGELIIIDWLKENNINYIHQKRFKDCRNKLPLPFDFYLPEYNMCIEYHGRQHYTLNKEYYYNIGKDINYLIEQYKNIKIRDEIKRKYCEDKNIKLLIIKYTKYNKIEQILKENIYDKR